MVDLLFSVLLQGLKLWNQKESTKYIDRVLKLRSDWLSEYQKPRNIRSNSNLDEIEQELQLIAKMFTKGV